VPVNWSPGLPDYGRSMENTDPSLTKTQNAPIENIRERSPARTNHNELADRALVPRKKSSKAKKLACPYQLLPGYSIYTQSIQLTPRALDFYQQVMLSRAFNLEVVVNRPPGGHRSDRGPWSRSTPHSPRRRPLGARFRGGRQELRRGGLRTRHGSKARVRVLHRRALWRALPGTP
jgi:hypothetical protein